MKLITITLLMSIYAYANAKTISENGQDFSCTPVKSCEQSLKEARAEIKRLKSIIKQNTVQEKIVTTVKTVEIVKNVHKKHILSITASKQAYEISTKSDKNSATGEIKSAYLPNITYQYQFETGLVPQIGVSSNKSIILGLGIEF